jgi:murein DD-endopeptidase MepM/ murein hydrolase activator NlpD
VSTYVSKLDAEIEYEVVDAPNNIKWAFKDVITTTINMKPQTDVEKVISYLTVKYGDFKFDDQITAEINEIVKNLYTVTYKEWDEVKHHNGKDPFGNPTSWNETIHHLDITLDGITLDQYLEKNKDTLFVNDEYSRYLTLADVGGETFRVELGSPFMGQDWESLISSRFGWRIHPITKKLCLHEGLDIAMPAGTQINAVMDGTVTTGYEPEGLGKYIVVTNGDISTKYGHCSKILVTEGTVKKGDVIALVGSTGSLSTGDHLHLEYTKNGINLNPLFYLEK